jgi:hypothetical protein
LLMLIVAEVLGKMLHEGGLLFKRTHGVPQPDISPPKLKSTSAYFGRSISAMRIALATLAAGSATARPSSRSQDSISVAGSQLSSATRTSRLGSSHDHHPLRPSRRWNHNGRLARVFHRGRQNQSGATGSES